MLQLVHLKCCIPQLLLLGKSPCFQALPAGELSLLISPGLMHHLALVQLQPERQHPQQAPRVQRVLSWQQAPQEDPLLVPQEDLEVPVEAAGHHFQCLIQADARAASLGLLALVDSEVPSEEGDHLLHFLQVVEEAAVQEDSQVLQVT